MNANAIINALGGTSETARLCEIKPPSVAEWRIRGIPKYRVMYLRLLRPDLAYLFQDAQNKQLGKP